MRQTLEGHNSVVSRVAFSPDGKWVLTGSSDRTACLWESSSGKLLHTLEGHGSSVNSVAFSPDGRWVLTGSDDETTRLWETSSGKLLQTLKGHTGEGRSVAFSPDGHIITTCDSNGRVFFWRARGLAIGQLLGLYVATYEVEAIYWQDATHVVLADTGGPDDYPHIYRLKLEGRW